MIAVLTRRVVGDRGEIKMPKRSGILKTWMLPVMGAALAEDEVEAEAFEMLQSVRNLKK